MQRFLNRRALVGVVGIATATLTSTQGSKTTARQRVALTATTSGGCEVLHLLNLLGLVAISTRSTSTWSEAAGSRHLEEDAAQRVVDLLVVLVTG
ncbi:MAG: hypothetical protein M3065_19215 [Actinomycetota bacterium]|nr:hypothetical protein [Actinomycetota bacterium]